MVPGSSRSCIFGSRASRAACAAAWCALVLGGCPATAPRAVVRDVVDDPCAHTSADPRCRPDETHAPVLLSHPLAGCTPGPRGRAVYSTDAGPLAELLPGEQKLVRLPRGDVVIVARVGPEEREQRFDLALMGHEPVLVETGCPAASFAGSGLAPLVLRGPTDGQCPAVRVRAGGLDFELVSGLTWTLLMPLGDHVVRLGGESVVVAVGEGGARLDAPGCGAGANRRGPLTAGGAPR